ncbi:MAG: hypothetical protein KAX80_00675 [Planctomycetes bacterium]|nr:hypothetical protein [Planctomycetota bacterium]
MKYEEFLNDLLRQTKRRLKLMELGAGLVIFLAALVTFLTFAVIVDHTLALAKVARWAVLVALDGTVVVVLLVAVVFVLRRLNDLYAARLIEKHYPGFRNTLISYLETRPLSDVPTGIKAFLEDQATERALDVQPDLVVSPRRVVVGAYALLLAILFFFFYALLTPKSVAVALHRIWEPGADIPPATATRIINVEPGSAAALIGSDVPVRVDLRGVVPERVTVRWSREQELWDRLELTPAKEGRRWETALADVEYDLFYYIEAGDARSPTYHLIVVPTPLVTRLQTHYEFPAYSGLPERLTHRGDVDALDGTVITVRAHTNTILARAHLAVNNLDLPAAIHQPELSEEPGDTVEGSFTVTRTGSFQIHLEDPYGFTNPEPPRYEILCRYDQSPTVRILEPEHGARVPLGEPLRIRFEASDDLGLAGLQFRYKIPGQEEEKGEDLPLPADLKEVQSEVTVHLDRLGLEPGRSLACYLQATDTFPEVPHVGRSDTLVVLVPSLEEPTELYARVEPAEPEPPTPEPAEPEEQRVVEAVPAVAEEVDIQPADEEQEPPEATLEELVARDVVIIDTIRRHLEEEAQAQAPAEQPEQQPEPAVPGEPAQPVDVAQAAGPAEAQDRAQATEPGEAGLQPAGQEPVSGAAQRAAADASLPAQDQGPAGDEPGAGHGEVPAAGDAGAGEPAGGDPAEGDYEPGPVEGEAPEAEGGYVVRSPFSEEGEPPEVEGGSEGQGSDCAGGGESPGNRPGSGPGGSGAPRAGGTEEGQSGQPGEQGARAQAGQQGQPQADQGRGEPSSQPGQQGAQGEGGQQAQSQAGQAGPATSPQAQGSGAQSAGAGGQGESVSPRVGDDRGETLTPGPLEPGGGGGTSPGGGGGGGRSGEEAPELQARPELEQPTVHPEDLEVVGQIIEELFHRLLRNQIDPELLEDLNWDIQDLAAWVVTYKAKLDQLPEEKTDAGVALGEALSGLPPPEERVIEMGSPVKPVTPTVGDEVIDLSPDEIRELLQASKGTLSPEYRQLLEDYYKALSDASAE